MKTIKIIKNVNVSEIDNQVRPNRCQQRDSEQNKNTIRNNSDKSQYEIENYNKYDQNEKSEVENIRNYNDKTNKNIIIPKKKTKQNKNNKKNINNNSISNTNQQTQNKNIIINNTYQTNEKEKYDNNKNMTDNNCKSHLTGCENTIDSHTFELHNENENETKISMDKLEKIYDCFVDNHMTYLDSDWNDLIFEDESEDEDEKQILSEDKKTKKHKEKKVSVSPRFLNETIVWLYSKFKEEHPECKISFTTFWKNIPKYFLKNGKKRTDICHLCEYGKNAVKNFASCNDPEIKKEVINITISYFVHFF